MGLIALVEVDDLLIDRRIHVKSIWIFSLFFLSSWYLQFTHAATWLGEDLCLNVSHTCLVIRGEKNKKECVVANERLLNDFSTTKSCGNWLWYHRLWLLWMCFYLISGQQNSFNQMNSLHSSRCYLSDWVDELLNGIKINFRMKCEN